LKPENSVVLVFVEHDYRSIQSAKFTDKLTAHATWAGWWCNICGYGDRSELAVAFGNSLCNGDPLSTCAYRIRGVLDVGAIKVGIVDRDDRGANTEATIGAVRSGLGGDTALA